MARFTCFESFAPRLSKIPDRDDRAAVALAIMEYGLEGVEPALEYPLDAIFEGFRSDIDNSVKSSTENRGGRPKKPKKEEDKTEVFENENPGFKKTETPVLETENACSEESKPNTNQANTTQAEPSQDVISSSDTPPYARIVDYLNAKAGSNYRASSAKSKQHINARWREGYRFDDFKVVIDNKVADWKGSEFEKFLRPETLFGPKFEGYLNAPRKEVKSYAKYDR